MKYLTMSALMMTVVFILFSVANAGVNIAEWTQLARIGCAAVMGIGFILPVFLGYMEGDFQ